MNQSIFTTKDFELLPEVAEASVSLNPTFRWCKFILTDDQPNLNGHRIPIEEFDNLIKTGIHAPIKMAANEIKDGHEDAVPIGTITHLEKEGNCILGLAALWAMERPEDVERIKQYFSNGQQLNLSWEVLYSDAIPEDGNVISLRNTALRATTLVGMPAYAGRTPVLAVASVEKEGALDLEEMKMKMMELEEKLAEALQKVSSLEEQLLAVTLERDALASFKKSIEEAALAEQRLSEIRAKFQSAGINKDDEYFEQNRERLLSMTDETLDFIIQEAVAFASTLKESQASIPVLHVEQRKLTGKEIGELLRKNRSK